jgi:hypothetical protein
MFQKMVKAALMPLAAGALAVSCFAQAAEPATWVEVDGGAWTVPDEVRSAMAAGLQAEAESHWGSGRRRPLESYTVQYQGKTMDGVRTVKLAGACSVTGMTPERLKKAFFLVFDGGTCFFEATYDPAQGRYLSFSFHGHA